MGVIRGVRIPVKLPWKGATDNTDQFVSMKEPVAKFLKFSSANSNDLEFDAKVNIKDGKDSKDTGTRTIKRRRSPGYKQRAIRLVFQIGSGNKTTGAKARIGNTSVATLQFPITKSVPINDVVTYFETGAGKSLKVLKVVDANTGKGYAIIP